MVGAQKRGTKLCSNIGNRRLKSILFGKNLQNISNYDKRTCFKGGHCFYIITCLCTRLCPSKALKLPEAGPMPYARYLFCAHNAQAHSTWAQ